MRRLDSLDLFDSWKDFSCWEDVLGLILKKRKRLVTERELNVDYAHHCLKN